MQKTQGEDYARPLRSPGEAEATGQAAGAARLWCPVDTRARRLAAFLPALFAPGFREGGLFVPFSPGVLIFTQISGSCALCVLSHWSIHQETSAEAH